MKPDNNAPIEVNQDYQVLLSLAELMGKSWKYLPENPLKALILANLRDINVVIHKCLEVGEQIPKGKQK